MDFSIDSNEVLHPPKMSVTSSSPMMPASLIRQGVQVLFLFYLWKVRKSYAIHIDVILPSGYLTSPWKITIL